MSVLGTITASCVHCTWRTDVEGDALREARDVHELMHPGGTVLVGDSPVDRLREIPERTPEEAPVENGRVCKRDGCGGVALDRRGRYAGLCADHKREARGVQSHVQTGQPRGAPKAAATPQRASAPEPASPPAQANGHSALVDLAQAVEDITRRRSGMLAALDELDREQREAVAELEAALSEHRL